MPQGYIPSHLKERNSRIIFDIFDDGKLHSKADISRLTGISAPTVNKIVDSLLKKKILLDTGEGPSNVGRKPNLLSRNEKAYYAIGVDFLQDKVRVGLVDLDGNMVGFAARRLVLPIDKLLTGTVCTMILQLINKYIIDIDRILGVCIGMPGVVDTERNVIEYSHTIGFQERTDCSDIMHQMRNALKIPIFIENDINAAAVGEFKARKLSKSKDLVYIHLGYGLGAGLVLNGKLRRGINYFAGEIAFISFDENFKTGKARKGWLEEKIGGPAVVNAISNPSSSEEYIKNVAKKIALMLANTSVFLDFNLVVIGGLLTRNFKKELLSEIEKRLQERSLLYIDCSIALSDHPELVGCAAIVYEKRLKDVL